MINYYRNGKLVGSEPSGREKSTRRTAVRRSADECAFDVDRFIDEMEAEKRTERAALSRRIRKGDRVYWEDPDGGLCSGRYTVTRIRGEVVSLRRGTHEAEAPRHELVLLRNSGGKDRDLTPATRGRSNKTKGRKQ